MEFLIKEYENKVGHFQSSLNTAKNSFTLTKAELFVNDSSTYYCVASHSDAHKPHTRTNNKTGRNSQTGRSGGWFGLETQHTRALFFYPSINYSRANESTSSFTFYRSRQEEKKVKAFQRFSHSLEISLSDMSWGKPQRGVQKQISANLNERTQRCQEQLDEVHPQWCEILTTSKRQ